jgi:hypothetical protein
MRSSHQLRIEGIEQALQHAAAFQLAAARHKVLVILDALADDLACCEALLLKIDHLLGEAFIVMVSRSTLPTVASQVNSGQRLSAAR